MKSLHSQNRTKNRQLISTGFTVTSTPTLRTHNGFCLETISFLQIQENQKGNWWMAKITCLFPENLLSSNQNSSLKDSFIRSHAAVGEECIDFGKED